MIEFESKVDYNNSARLRKSLFLDKYGIVFGSNVLENTIRFSFK